MEKAEETKDIFQRRPRGCITCLKVFLHAFNVFFLIVGLVLIGVGVWSITSLQRYFKLSSIYHSYSLWILIVIGIAIVVISCAGFYCTQNNESVHLLYMYGSFITVIVVAQLGAGIAALILRDKITEMLKNGLMNNLQLYGSDSSVSNGWDDVQQALQCCGVMNYTDWGFLPGNDNGTIDTLPKSCCAKEKQCRNVTETFPVGCFWLVDESVRSGLGVLVGIAFGFISVQIVGEILAFCLATETRHQSYELIM